MVKRVGVVALLLSWFQLAHADRYGSTVGYHLKGYSADGKYAFFEKQTSTMTFSETWLAVFDATTTKLVTSQPVYRNCNPMSGRDPDDPPPKDAPEGPIGHDPCAGRGSPIGTKTGARTAEKIHKTYGAIAATTKLVEKGNPDEAAATDPKGAGQLQTFAGTGVEVKVTSKLAGRLPDPMKDPAAKAGFDLEVTLTAGATTWSAKHRIYVDPSEDAFHGNIQRWERLYVEGLATAAGHRSAALVFCGKPIVLAPRK
jgi:hypothetical protein